MKKDSISNLVSHWNLLYKEGYIDSVQSAITGYFYGILLEEFFKYLPLSQHFDERSVLVFSKWFYSKLDEIKSL